MFFSPYIWNTHPSWRTHIFQRGRNQPPTSNIHNPYQRYEILEVGGYPMAIPGSRQVCPVPDALGSCRLGPRKPSASSPSWGSLTMITTPSISTESPSDWLVVTNGTWMDLSFQKYWEFHHPNWRPHIFQSGWNHQPAIDDGVYGFGESSPLMAWIYLGKSEIFSNLNPDPWPSGTSGIGGILMSITVTLRS